MHEHNKYIYFLLSHSNLDPLHGSSSSAQYINDNYENKREVALNYCLLNQDGKLRPRVYLTALLRRANRTNYEPEYLRSSSLNCQH